MSYPYLTINGHKVSLIPPFTIDNKLICKILSCDIRNMGRESSRSQYGFYGTVCYETFKRYYIEILLHTGEKVCIFHDDIDLSMTNDRMLREYEYATYGSHCGNGYVRSECSKYRSIYHESITKHLNRDVEKQCTDIQSGRPISNYLEELYLQNRPVRQNIDMCLDRVSDVRVYDNLHNLVITIPAVTTTISSNDFQAKMSVIHTHLYMPTYKKHYLPEEDATTTLLLGAEIEVDNGGESETHAKKVLKIMNGDNCEEHIYCVHDGSLQNGLEFPTQPCSLAYHKTLPYQEMFKYLDENGYKAHDTTTCGLHVHINRSFFANKEKECIGKLLYIVEKFNDDFSVIGRRDCKYSRFLGYKGEKCKELYEINDNPCETSVSYKNPKYNAINLLHKDTIEIRAFKGTLKYSTFINTLEFVSDLAHFVKNHTEEEVENMEWSDLYDTFSDELKKYYDERKQIEAKKLQNTDAIITDTPSNRGSRINMNLIEDYTVSDLNSIMLQMRTCNMPMRFQSMPVEKTNEEKVKDLKQKIKTERNYMAKIKLQKEIHQLQREIKREKKRKQRN